MSFKRRDRDEGQTSSSQKRSRQDLEAPPSAAPGSSSRLSFGFGEDLSGQFVWHKKAEKSRKLGLTEQEAARREEQRRLEARDELDKLNRRRAEREHEARMRETEAARLAVLNESAQMAEWISKEDDFYLEQAKKRAEIRVRERRAKPIDFLALNLKWSIPRDQMQLDQDDGEGLDVDLEEPYAIFENINLEETEQLEQDIKMFLSLERNPYNQEFWRSMLLVCASALEDRRTEQRLGQKGQEQQAKTEEAIKAEFARMLKGKAPAQLTALQGSVQAKLTSGEPIDVEYWENLLKEIIVWKAKAKLKDMHEVVLQNRLEQLRRKQRDEAHQMQAELASALPQTPVDASETSQAATKATADGLAAEVDAWDPEMEPRPLPFLTDDDKQLELLDPAEDRQALYAARRAVHATRFVSRKQRSTLVEQEADQRQKDAVAEALYQAEVEKGLDEDEELFNMEKELTRQTYVWEDKYRPRKPRYFNKVMTGFEWNKYNQTHYDSDNPPPKVVTGYRMVLFYPDLIDKTKAPQFKIHKDRTNPNAETATLVFTAGPPYEDIAFTIINKEWDFSHKKGYRCSFDRGVLQLAFSYKKLHYRK